MMPTRAIASVMLVVALSAAGCEPGRRDPSPTLPTLAPAESVTPIPGAPDGWVTYAYRPIGLRFAYPPLAGQISENPRAVTGTRHSWIIRRTDRCNARGECRAYEFAAVNDGCPDSAAWPTFAHRWVQSGSAHSIETCADRRPIPLPRALRTVQRPDGARGIIYDANVWFGPNAQVPGAKGAVLNFPTGYHDRYDAVAFYFDDAIRLDTIETVLQLVTLSR